MCVGVWVGVRACVHVCCACTIAGAVEFAVAITPEPSLFRCVCMCIVERNQQLVEFILDWTRGRLFIVLDSSGRRVIKARHSALVFGSVAIGMGHG